MTLSLFSPTFENGADIPLRFTRDGENQSPALAWQDLPEDTQSLALIVENPNGVVRPVVHWAIYNISPDKQELPEGIVRTPQVSGIGTQGINHFYRTGYDGPCASDGSDNCYRFKLYALDLPPNLSGGLSGDDLLKTIQRHMLAQAEWTGQYRNAALDETNS
jgi:Raf kinase inhibitor-like YbhB/YbcL family protein